MADDKLYDFAIIGGGAAGLSAGIYAARYKLKTVVVRGKDPGGETAIAATVENYPGFKSIDGYELIQKMEDHASSTGVELRDGEVIDVLRQAHCFDLLLSDGAHVQARNICFALGARHRRLGLLKEKELTGHGISYCTTCDAPLYKGKEIIIVGGGDSSVKGANLAGEYVAKIYFVVRGDKIIAEPVNWDRFEKNLLKTGKAEVLYNTEVKEILGTDKFEGVRLSKSFKDSDVLKAGGLFVQVGASPNNEMAKKLGVELDEKGYIHVDKFMKTNVDGIFAAGDITDGAGTFRQDIIAAAQGAMAATAAYWDLGVHGGQACEVHALPILAGSLGSSH
ncbi:FAD-dependent oxidoreductase [Candidatus Uhrbacteria bacterium]|nr:FAD-dependent oxidoreductase [Candidatus Uhrbacteria bacterium]